MHERNGHGLPRAGGLVLAAHVRRCNTRLLGGLVACSTVTGQRAPGLIRRTSFLVGLDRCFVFLGKA